MALSCSNAGALDYAGHLCCMLDDCGTDDLIYIQSYGATALLAFDMKQKQWKWSAKCPLRHRPLFSRRTPGSGGQELPGVRSSELDAANEGRIYVSAGGLARVLDAYRAQFQGDFRLFLACRAEEVRCDGLLLLLTFVARREAVPSVHDCHLWDLLAAAVEGMAAEGLVDACRLDSFEAPYYRPCPDELTEAIREEAPLR
ncbi:hypothetical protein E2562_029797 [Oryza meyeriana var. granulata]|uniref:Uncharacterized protein n=1 Tax=Oryza meyeriana var. granulata TaxID=110450 RepID=A0A6G1E6K4_9ORYZ|nr:hypothetical protein E2562_029797 [Oryza meyeriana var. granulata]